MCCPERNTDSRGRPPDLWRNWKRRRTRRRVRSSWSVLMRTPSPALRGRDGVGKLPAGKHPLPDPPPLRGRGGLANIGCSLLLPFLAADLFVGVADALALVGFRPA